MINEKQLHLGVIYSLINEVSKKHFTGRFKRYGTDFAFVNSKSVLPLNSAVSKNWTIEKEN